MLEDELLELEDLPLEALAEPSLDLLAAELLEAELSEPLDLELPADWLQDAKATIQTTTAMRTTNSFTNPCGVSLTLF